MGRIHDEILAEFKAERRNRNATMSRLIAKTTSIEGVQQIIFGATKVGNLDVIVRELLERAIERPEEIRDMLERTEQPRLL